MRLREVHSWFRRRGDIVECCCRDNGRGQRRHPQTNVGVVRADLAPSAQNPSGLSEYIHAPQHSVFIMYDMSGDG